jgi:UDP-N-acetyl-2-amino-2-deoxyglucuronate dehydrogenase
MPNLSNLAEKELKPQPQFTSPSATKTPISNRFFFEGKGFIYPKHKEAMESIGGVEVDKIEEADWVVILTPNYLHYEMILEALEKGKKVLCEKPLVIKPEHCQDLIHLQRTHSKTIYTVAQLRYHPILNKIPRKSYNEIEIYVEVHRDKEYWKSWKADPEKSGGILYNLGIHYLDLVIWLFGEPKEAHWNLLGDKENMGYFKGDDYICKYDFSYKAPPDKQRRVFRINGVEYDLREPHNLHKKVYQDLIQGRGISPDEVLSVIKLIEKLK